MGEQTTYAVKIDTEVKQELSKLLEGYKEGTSANAGDFMKVLIDTYKLNKITNTISTVDADIKELNTLTARMYGIYSNMVQRIETNNNALQQQFGEELNKKNEITEDLRNKLAELQAQNELISNAFNNAVAEKEELLKENKQLQESNINYKEINSNLKEKVAELDQYKQENKDLTKQLVEVKKEYEDTLKVVLEQKTELSLKDNLIKDMEQKHTKEVEDLKEKATSDKQKASAEFESLKENHNKQVADLKEKYNNQLQELKLKQDQELIQVKDKAEFNKEKAILELEREHQHKIQQQQDNFNNSINGYQQDYKKLLEELENFKKQPTKPTKGKKAEE